ncbi:MAG: ATP-binding cassette domain-containing protein [Selenomonas sp.]|nr:ATP-binding cassette domain-containing protein [Selenomonas sp.]
MTETLKLLLSHTEKKALLTPLLAGLMASLTALGLMGAGAWLIAKAALQPPLYTLALGVTCVRACGIFRAVFRYLERYSGHKLAFNAYCELQESVYALALSMLPLKSGALSQGLWLERLIKDCSQLRDAYVRALLPLALNLVITIAFCWILYDCHPLLSLTLLLTFAVMAALGWLLTREPRSSPAKSAYRQELLEIAEGREELLAAGSAPPSLIRLQKRAECWQLQQAKEQERSCWLELLLSLVKYSGFTLLFYQLCLLVPARMDYIELAVWLLLLLTLCQDYNGLLPALEQMKEARAAGKSLAVAASTSASTAACKGDLLQVDNLTFGYNDQPLFHNLSFTIAPHQHTAIMGESGRGKTTLAYLLAGLYQPEDGTIKLSAPPAGNLQGGFIFSGSIRENFLRLHPGLPEEEMIACLETAQLADCLTSLPQGLDTPLGFDGSSLSGGERNRLLTALALAAPSPLLLLDEPTAGLDKKTASRLLEALFERVQEQGRTLVIITHELNILDRFRQVIEL